MKFGSLFAGIGGIDLGLERAGMECLWQVEWDDYCQRVLAKHWPNVARYGDIHGVGKHNLEAVDLIAGGFPCQPVSFAGRQKGIEDDRWLWPEFYRVVLELRPRYVLVENVPGLYHQGFGEVITDLAKSGYDAEWNRIFAASVGAPHLRERVFIIAYRQCVGWPEGSSQRIQSIFQVPERQEPQYIRPSISTGRTMAHTDQQGPQGYGAEHELRESQEEFETSWSGWWRVEPNVGRVAYGVPNRVDRLRALGNAVVPQVAEWIGQQIMDSESRRHAAHD